MSAERMIHGLSASTFRPASTEATMRSILTRLRPDMTTTLPGFSRIMRSRKSGSQWISSSHEVGFSARELNRAILVRCSATSVPSGAYTVTRRATSGYISF